MYKNREDKLVYRSVTFNPDLRVQPKDLTIANNHYRNRECVILKMSQRFELDPYKPAEGQIRKTEFNLAKGMVYIYYHFREGKVTAKFEEFERDKLIGQVKVGDINDKDTEESKEQQVHKRIIEMERKCHE